MKKNIVIMALLATAMGATAAKKAKKVQEPEKPKVEIVTKSDSLSYTAGMAHTEGLLPYLQGQLNVDTTYMADFIKGFNDAVEKAGDPAFAAYAAGLQIQQMVGTRMLPGLEGQLKETGDSVQTDKFYAGFVAALKNDSSVIGQKQASEYFQEEMKRVDAEKKRIAAEKLEKEFGPNREAGKAFLAENAKKEGVKTTESGLQYKVLTQGNGPVAKATDEVVVKYEGHLIDGTEFDSSYKRPGETSKFRANQVIKGWTEALTMMPAGSKWELYIPQEIAYGDRNQGKIKPYSALIFTVEVVDILRDGKSIVNVEAAPAAKTTAKKSSKKK